MTDRTASPDAALREVALEPGASVEITISAADLRLRGTDGDRVVVRGRDGGSLGDSVRIDAAPGVLRIRDADTDYRLGPLFLSMRRTRDLDIDLPSTAAVVVRTTSGDIEATGIAGDSRWASMSGSLRLGVAGGSVHVETMSGDATLEATGAIALAARTVSGNLRVRARRLEAVDAGTTSGNVRIEGDLAGSGDHQVSSVSGDVEVVTGSPVTLRVRTLTGDVRASGRHSAEGGRGQRTLVVGDGSVALAVRTTSGDVRLRAIDQEPEAPVAPEPPPARALDEEEDTHAWAAPEPVVDRREADRLEVLRALERGDLDIETAAHRLEVLEQAGPRYFRGWC